MGNLKLERILEPVGSLALGETLGPVGNQDREGILEQLEYLLDEGLVLVGSLVQGGVLDPEEKLGL